MKYITRLQQMKLHFFKNIEYGEITFPGQLGKQKYTQSDILGIYGQNGSGKTAVIRALGILQTLINGHSLPSDIAQYITVGASHSMLMFEMYLSHQENQYKVFYEITLSNHPVIVTKEKISFRQKTNEGFSKLLTLIDYDLSYDELFRPKARISEFINGSRERMNEIKYSQKTAIKQQTSFIFSNNMETEVIPYLRNEHYKNILIGLHAFARNNLYIVDTKLTGFIPSNLMFPFTYKNIESNTTSIEILPFDLTEPTALSSIQYNAFVHALKTTNRVITQLIPDLELDFITVGDSLDKNGTLQHRIELLSLRNQKRIPLRYESDGIKKIISVLHLLICVYHQEGLTVAIDELDSGIYEYLFGELLGILDRGGKGQLLFTSHNLRPLEVLQKRSVLFTTSNPANRFIRLSRVKDSHNMRNIYFHDIILGGQSETIYEMTNNFAIDHAFRAAGDNDES